MKVAVLGELSKYVPISPQRISAVDVSEEDVVIQLKGANAEKVTMFFLVNNNSVKISCTFDNSMTATMSLTKKACAP